MLYICTLGLDVGAMYKSFNETMENCFASIVVSNNVSVEYVKLVKTCSSLFCKLENLVNGFWEIARR